MQVILVKPVRKLGKVGETVTVANGYGRNYLVPQELAIRATKENIEKFAILQKNLESQNTQNKIKAEQAVRIIEGKHIDFITQSAADGRLFGSVSAKNLAIEISKLVGFNLNYSNILLDTPIKFNGVFNVQVILHSEIITNILVIVAKSTADAQNALIDYNATNLKTTEETTIIEEEESLAI